MTSLHAPSAVSVSHGNKASVTTAPDARATALLQCGLYAGPVFLATSLVQGLTRAGFDLSHQPVSFLSLGSLGWLQRANFVVAGLLALASRWGFGAHGAGVRGAGQRLPPRR